MTFCFFTLNPKGTKKRDPIKRERFLNIFISSFFSLRERTSREEAREKLCAKEEGFLLSHYSNNAHQHSEKKKKTLVVVVRFFFWERHVKLL